MTGNGWGYGQRTEGLIAYNNSNIEMGPGKRAG